MKFGPPDPSTPKWEQWFKIWCTWVVVVMPLSKACPCYSMMWQLQPMYISVAHKTAKASYHSLGNSQKILIDWKKFFCFWSLWVYYIKILWVAQCMIRSFWQLCAQHWCESQWKDLLPKYFENIGWIRCGVPCWLVLGQEQGWACAGASK
jgi:hypothetical protein